MPLVQRGMQAPTDSLKDLVMVLQSGACGPSQHHYSAKAYKNEAQKI